MKLDIKKIKSVLLTYGTLALPVAIVSFSLNANTTVKILSFASGFIPVVVRQTNPKDPFTLNILALTEAKIDARLAKEKAKADKAAKA